MEFLISILITFAFLFLLFIFRETICQKLMLIDYPKEDDFHKIKSYLFGGIFLFTSLLLNIFFLLIDEKYSNNYFSFFLLVSFFIVAFIDDIKNLNPYLRLFISIIICIVSIYYDPNLKIRSLNFYFDKNIYLSNNLFFEYFLTTLCIVLFVNAFNFLDGIDGLATSIGLSFFLYLIIKNSIILNIYSIFLIALILFLFLNLKYNVFLGDSGNYIISLTIAIILLKENYHQPSLYYSEEIFLLLLIPGIDMLRLFFIRIFKKQSPFRGDKNHFHHKLFYKFGKNKTLIIYLILVNFPVYLYFFTGNFLISLIILSSAVYFILLRKMSL